jgi:hypothetical protein
MGMMPVRAVEKWLVHCADPELPPGLSPRRRLSPRSVRKLVDAAEAHGVLPAVLRNFAPFRDGQAYQAARQYAFDRRRLAVAYSTVLRGYSEPIMMAVEGSPVRLVKGRAFAEVLYPQAFLRTFTDIDLLTTSDATRALTLVLLSQGFYRIEGSGASQPHETKWLHRDNAEVMVEVHTNLVHNRRMQRAVSLTYEDLVDVPAIPAHLVTAAVHGALDGFSRIRQVVDLCQAARKLLPRDEHHLERLLARTGSRLATATGLELAFRMFGEPRAREIAAAIQTRGNKKLVGALLDPFVVTALTRPTRLLHSWRRQWYRMLLARNLGISNAGRR